MKGLGCFKSVMLLLFFVSGTACSSTSYFLLKNHHFDTSETQGAPYKFKASFVGYQDVTAVVTDMSFANDTPEEGSTRIARNDSGDFGASGFDHSSLLMDLALSKRLDISIDFAMGQQPNYVKMKYQFIGDRENPDDRFSVSAIFGLGYVNMDDSDESVNGIQVNNFKVTGPVVRGAISAGVRADGGLLVYWSNSYSKFMTTTDFDRETLSDGSFEINGDQMSSMLGLSYVANGKVSAGIEYGYIFANSDYAEQNSFTSFAANIGYLF